MSALSIQMLKKVELDNKIQNDKAKAATLSIKKKFNILLKNIMNKNIIKQLTNLNR
jgi:hypothetical protein